MQFLCTIQITLKRMEFVKKNCHNNYVYIYSIYTLKWIYIFLYKNMQGFQYISRQEFAESAGHQIQGALH